MARRASPGSRELIELELGSDELRTLRSMCRVLRIPADRWQAVPSLLEAFSTLAGLKLAARLELEGYSQTEARATAARWLDLEPATLQSRVQRARMHVLRLGGQPPCEDDAA